MAEINLIKKIKTSCPFPLLQLEAKVKYNEVRKASGIAYILLELIQKSAMGKEEIKNVLKTFGIPLDLHYMFAQELYSLVKNDILNTSIDAQYITNMKHFDEMTLDMFRLSGKGKKMFAEGAIPTGEEKGKVTKVYYNFVNGKFSLDTTLGLSDINTSFLGESFIDGIKYDMSGLEDFIKSVQTKIGLKAEEMIVSVDEKIDKKLVGKKDENLTISIYDDGAEFTLATTDEQAFFAKHYSSALMSRGMLMKDNYKFKLPVPTVAWSDIKANNLYIPTDSAKQAERPCKVFINRGTHGYKRTDKTISYENADTYLDILDKNAEFALLDSSGCKFYMPLNVKIPCKNFDDEFEIQLLVETLASAEQVINLYSQIYDDCIKQEFTPEKIRTVEYVASVLQNWQMLEDYVRTKLKEQRSDEDRIDLLLKINSLLAKGEDWAECFKLISKQIFDGYTQAVNVGNVAFSDTVLTPLRKAMGMSDSEYITALSTPLLSTESVDIVYQALESVGFKESEILTVANVVESYARKAVEHTPIDSATELARKFKLMSSNMWKLCDMLGVEDPYEYTIGDDYNDEEFINAFATYDEARNKIEKYRAYAKSAYETLDVFYSVLSPVQEVIAIEKTAAEHPERITKKFIDEQISRGKYNVVVSNLLIKAQYDLRNTLKADKMLNASEIIDLAESKGIIDRKQASGLHKLRMCRNGFQHPEQTQIPFTKADLEDWRDIVFLLKGVE